jgi:membrane protease YdiL (CAAX protease family)
MITQPTARKTASIESRRLLWIEFWVVLGFAYLPSFFSQFLPYAVTRGAMVTPTHLATTMGRYLALLLIVVIADDNLEGIGLKAPVWKNDFIVLAGLAIFSYLLYELPGWILPADQIRHLSIGNKPGSVVTEAFVGATFLATVPRTVISAFGQEILFRGYMFDRLKQLLGNVWAPVLISTVLFSIWHLYESPIGLIRASIMGLVFSLVYVKTGRIWPLFVVHAATNLALNWMYFAYLGHSGFRL